MALGFSLPAGTVIALSDALIRPRTAATAWLAGFDVTLETADVGN